MRARRDGQLTIYTRRMTGLALVLLLLWQATPQPPPKPSEAAAALAAAEAKWQKNTPAVYEFTIEVICFCPIDRTPPTFRVTNGVPVRAGASDPKAPSMYDYYDTIEELFTVVKRYTSRNGIRINVKYDAELGYPVSADLDQAENMADDEMRFNVTNFKVVRK